MSDCSCCPELTEEEEKELGENPTTTEVLDILRKRRRVMPEAYDGPGISPLSPPTPEVFEMARNK